MIIVDEDVLFYAFRYALGRATYAVHTVVTDILDNWDNLSEKTKQLMKKEIAEYRERNGLCGMKMDDDMWQEIMIR